jgi:hypothetical protein
VIWILPANSWRYSGAVVEALNVVISPNTGVVDGVVSNTEGRPIPGARVVLIPEGNRERRELFRPAVSDANGRFSLTGISPGRLQTCGLGIH